MVEVEEDIAVFSLVMDEATFTRNGVYNFRTTHVWLMENSHAVAKF